MSKMENMPVCVGETYRLDHKIGSGSYGVIYLGTDIISGKSVAIKMELRTAKNPHLESEYKIYQTLAGGVGISQVYWFGRACNWNAMVLDVLGPSLRDLLKFCGGKFTLKTVLLLADQLLERIEYIHSKNFIHRDVKPANFVMGLDMTELDQVYVIDFGLAKSYYDPNTHQHIPHVAKKSRTGTPRFMSINAHCGYEQSSRDDLQSLGYMLVYFFLGRLPWQGMKASSRNEFHYMIMVKKMTTPDEILCRSLPSEFATYLEYCRALEFEEKPEYKGLRRLFRNAFLNRRFSQDNIFDWAILNSECGVSRKIVIDCHPDPSSNRNSRTLKESKASDKSGEQDRHYVRVPEFCNGTVKILKIANYI